MPEKTGTKVWWVAVVDTRIDMATFALEPKAVIAPDEKTAAALACQGVSLDAGKMEILVRPF